MSNSTVPAPEADAAAEAPIVDAQVVDEAAPERPTPVPPGPSTELVRQEGATPTLFRDYGEDPSQMMAVAERVASSIKDVLTKQGLTSKIGGKDHVDIEGWQVSGRLTGVAVEVTSKMVCHPVTGEPIVTKYDVAVKDYKWAGGKKQHVADRTYTVEGHDWEASARAILPDGTLVGSSDAICSRSEDRWAQGSDSDLRGMAQTRASSRAYKAALGWVIHMAGYASTPSEEMDGVEDRLPHNQEADQDLKNLATAALVEMLGEPAAREVWLSLKGDWNNAMPVSVCQAMVTIGLAAATRAASSNGGGNGHQAEEAPVTPAPGGEVVTGEQILAIGKAFDAFGAPMNVRVAVLKTVAGVGKPAQVPVALYDPVMRLIAKIAEEAPDHHDAVFTTLQKIHHDNKKVALGGNIGPALDIIGDLNVPL